VLRGLKGLCAGRFKSACFETLQKKLKDERNRHQRLKFFTLVFLPRIAIDVSKQPTSKLPLTLVKQKTGNQNMTFWQSFSLLAGKYGFLFRKVNSNFGYRKKQRNDSCRKNPAYFFVIQFMGKCLAHRKYISMKITALQFPFGNRRSWFPGCARQPLGSPGANWLPNLPAPEVSKETMRATL